MGKRTLRVTAELFVEFLKRHDDASRWFTIDNPLPDDAKISEVRWLDDHNMGIVMESDTWPGVGSRPLSPVPLVRIYWNPPQVTQPV